MLAAIPNPKKSFEIDYSSQEVVKSLRYIPFLNKKYKFTSRNDLLKTYRYEALEFLSLGVYIDISINNISETKTRIEIEVLRKVGAFDKTYEVSEANRHISSVAELVSKCLTLTPNQVSDFESIISSTPEPDNTPPSRAVMTTVCIFLGLFGVHRLLMGYGNWAFMLLTLGGFGWWWIVDCIRLATGSMNMADGRELS
jgi:hypothetical protein